MGETKCLTFYKGFRKFTPKLELTWHVNMEKADRVVEQVEPSIKFSVYVHKNSVVLKHLYVVCVLRHFDTYLTVSLLIHEMIFMVVSESSFFTINYW